jgi:uncharacterized protein YqeY
VLKKAYTFNPFKGRVIKEATHRSLQDRRLAMGLKEKIQQDIKQAMKEKERDKLSTLRLLMSEIKNKEIDAGGDLEDSDILALIQKAAKQRKESIEQYKKGSRDELAAKEERELEILSAYLPQQLSREELEGIIKEAIAKCGATSPKEMGKVMKEVMPAVKGRADGKEVNALVRSMLEAGE